MQVEAVTVHHIVVLLLIVISEQTSLGDTFVRLLQLNVGTSKSVVLSGNHVHDVQHRHSFKYLVPVRQHIGRHWRFSFFIIPGE